MSPRAAALFIGLGAALLVRAAHADPSAPANAIAPELPLEKSTYVHLLGAAQFGRGLRLNNPFRLNKQLGSDGESLSLSAPYFDLSGAALLGNPDGLQHGLALRASFALRGIAQQVITPGYMGLYRIDGRWMVFGRAGIPIVTQPNPGAGLEVGLGGALMFASGIGVTAELLYDLFWGAATLETTRTIIPVVAGQAGIIVDFEVLP